MKSIEEITRLLGQPEGTWSGISECLEAIKENPLHYREKGLLAPEKLLELFPKETLRAHNILVLTTKESCHLTEPGSYLITGGKVIQHHHKSEAWYFGDTEVDVWSGKAHGYERARIAFSDRTSGTIHDQVQAISYGEYVRMEAYDHAYINFEKNGELDLYGNSKADAYCWSAAITTHDHSRLNARDVKSIRALDQSLVVGSDCRIVMEDQAAAVTYGNDKIEARNQNRVWMLNSECRPVYAKPEAIFCKAYEKEEFRKAIHVAVNSDRDVPELLSRLNDLTVAHGPAIHEDWNFGEEMVWLTRIGIDDHRNFTNVPNDWARYDNLYPTQDQYGHVAIQVFVEDTHAESSAMLNHLMEQRGYYLKDKPHTYSYAEFKHWGNALLFNETVRYEETVLHKLRPAVQLQEAGQEAKKVRQATR